VGAVREWVVAADDRTGAFEVAALLADVVGPTLVTVGRPSEGSCVVDIATRALLADEAAARAAAVEATPSHWAAHKIDSTLRGQWAAELRTRHEVGGRPVVVLPAWPQMGRTCIGGVVYVHGTPLGNVLELMPGTVLLADTAALRAWLAGDGLLAVCDIADDAAMHAAAAALAEVDNDVLVAGAAGPLGAVFAARSSGRYSSVTPPLDRPCLVVCGSANPVSREQVARLAAAHPHVVVVAAVSPANEGELEAGVAIALAEEARGVAAALQPSTVVLVGGDTAAAYLGDAPRLVGGSAAPGMPYSFDEHGAGPLVITKAGGFGAPDALVQLFSRRAG